MEINKISVNGTSYDIHDVRVTSDMTSAATPSTNGSGGTAGLMSAADKEKLDSIATGATANAGTVTGVTVGTGGTNYTPTNGIVTIPEYNVGTVTGVKIGTDGTSYTPTNGVVTIPAYPTDTNTVPQGYCNTAAGTQAKVVVCTDYALLDKSYLMVIIKNANSYNGKITLNVNGKGAKDIYINGTVSSYSNKTLPAGSYLVYYESNKYYFRTDGKITGSITGDAGSVGGNTITTYYAPTTTGTSGQVWMSNGSGGEWGTISTTPAYSNVTYTVYVPSSNSSGALTLNFNDGPVQVHTVSSSNISSVSTSNIPAGHSLHVIFRSDSSSATRTVAIAHNATTSCCPEGSALSLTVPEQGNGYTEVDFINVNNIIYVRGV